MKVDFIGNASRLDTMLGLRSADALQGGARGRNADFFRNHYPHYHQFRIGNVFLGFECAGKNFAELAVRGADGRLQYRFGQTLDMLQAMVSAGIKPHLALTGTPLALVPPGEAVIKHHSYGCVNAPRIDWTKPEPRDRMPEWWSLQDAFLAAVIDRFGKVEVQNWTFATWTEPMNPGRELAHLVLPKDVVVSGRHDEAVATVLAASIDVAMKHGVHIRIGNLAGRVQTDYPDLVRQIARFGRGKAYLEYIDGYAISRYRTRPDTDIGRNLDAAFSLLQNPAMPAKPLYIDEMGDLAGTDGAQPFEAASGLQGAQFVATVLERVYNRQDGTPRSPRSVAFWRDQIEPRPRNIFSQPEAYLRTPASHVTDMFASLNGYARLAVTGPERQAVAGSDGSRIKAILLSGAGAGAAAGGAPTPQTRTVTVKGLKANADFDLTITEVSRVQGNPISAFLDGEAGYAQDTKGRFSRTDGKWKLASPYWEACFYDEDSACAWRQKARQIENPLVRGMKIRTDGSGTLRTSMVVDEAGTLMVDIAPSI